LSILAPFLDDHGTQNWAPIFTVWIFFSIRQANAGYLLNSNKANCLTKYDFPFPRYQKPISISRSMIFTFQDIRNKFLFRGVWFSFSKISKTNFYFAKYDFPFPRY
jgi:hypothetical protein